MNPKLLLALALALSGGLLGCSDTAQIQKRVENLPEQHFDSFHVTPLEERIWGEYWLQYGPTPNAVRRYVFVPTGTATTFSATFVVADSTKHAHRLWQGGGSESQVMGKMSKNYGADELESWPGHLVGRWKQVVVVVYTNGGIPTSADEWSSVMSIIESAVGETNDDVSRR
jgi:hypothetical protein